MKSTNCVSNPRSNLNQPNRRRPASVAPAPRPATPAPAHQPPIPPEIRITAREYVNPVDYQHPHPSMDRFAGFLALQYDANRTRHAYYRQIRLIHEHFNTDLATLGETQLRLSRRTPGYASRAPPGPSPPPQPSGIAA